MAMRKRWLIRGVDWHYWGLEGADGWVRPQLYNTQKEARREVMDKGETVSRVKLVVVKR